MAIKNVRFGPPDELELAETDSLPGEESATPLISDKARKPKDLPALIRATAGGEPDFVSVGFGSAVAINRVLAVVAPDSAPIRRLLREARDKSLLIDATFGRKTKAVLVLDSGHLLTAALQPETIISRIRHKT